MLVTNTTGKPITYTNHRGEERTLNAGQGYGLSSAEVEHIVSLKLSGVKVAKPAEDEEAEEPKAKGKK